MQNHGVPRQMEAICDMVPPYVTPVLCHTKGEAYYPLDRCGSAFIEVGLRGCCCNPAQPIDYRLKTRDVTIDFEWQGGPQKA